MEFPDCHTLPRLLWQAFAGGPKVGWRLLIGCLRLKNQLMGNGMIRKILAVTTACTALINPALSEERERTEDQAKAMEIFRTIIGMRSTEQHGETPAMAAYLADELKAAGFPAGDIEIIPIENTAALVAKYRGEGPSDAKPILFLAHMDVVEANPEDWEHDPFTLREEDGWLLGRGASDNKYGVANLTQTFIRLKREGFVPSRDLILVFTGDEETSMATTKYLAYEREDLKDAEFVLNSDAGGGAVSAEGKVLPYFMQAAEKTYATFKVIARNPGGHSSAPKPDNAIYDLAQALLNIQAYRFPVMSNSITRASMRVGGMETDGELGKAMIAFADNPKNKKAIKTIRANYAYGHMLGTTCVATMLEAGHAENALPQMATATVNCRIFPGIEVEAVRQTLEEIIDNEELEVVPGDDDYLASPASEPREDVTSALLKALGERHPGIEIVPAMSSGGTDGMHFRRAGIQTYGVSSKFSVIGQSSNAHGLNERLPTSTFYDGLDHWVVIIKELAGPSE